MDRSRWRIEVCDSHIHLSRQDFKKLFGENGKLEPEKQLSQPGQFQAKQRLKVRGAAGTEIILPVYGPLRAGTQIEITEKEAKLTGIEAEYRVSGSTGSGRAKLISDEGSIGAENCTIIPKAHLHMPPEDASPYHLENLQNVSVKVTGDERKILLDVTVRISHMYVTRLHISAEEAKRLGIHEGMECTLA